MPRGMEKLGEVIYARRKALKLTQKQLGDLVGYGQTTISDWENGKIEQIRNPDKVADVLGIPRGIFRQLLAEAVRENEQVQRISPKIRETIVNNPNKSVDSLNSTSQSTVNVRQAPQSGARDVPVYGRAQGGYSGVFEFNGDIMGWESRPQTLEGVANAYALWVDGTSMYPRYKPGETVWINPNKPPKREDDVIVQLHPNDENEPPLGFVKEFVAWSGNYLVVKQHNPSEEIKYPREKVKSVHLIVYAQRSQ